MRLVADKQMFLKFFPYLIMLTVIIIFNLHAVWGLDGLCQDDQEYYFRLYDKNLGDLQFSRNILHAIYTLEINKIAGLTSIYAARFLVIIFLIIPCAFALYHLSTKHLKLIPALAVPISILPFILPNESLIPVYISGSYMLMGIFFALLTIDFILKTSENKRIWERNFILAIIFYFMAFESSELFAFMLPVFLFLILAFRNNFVKKLYLAAAFTIMAIGKSLMVMKRPHGTVNNVRHQETPDEIKERLIRFMDFINPFHGLADTFILNLLVVAIIITALIILIINHRKIFSIYQPAADRDESKCKHSQIVSFYLFPLAWMIFSLLPFIIFTNHMASRYLITAGIAVNFMLLISLAIIITSITRRKFPLIILAFLIIIPAGINRKQTFYKFHETLMKQFDELKNTLDGQQIPGESQIVVTTSYKNLRIGNGITRRGNGAVQYILKRRDINGQIMIERSFYDPFKINNNPWGFKDTDIDTTKKTILYRGFHQEKEKNRRMHYALRWIDDKNIESAWTLYHVDENFNFNNILNGAGYQAYEYAVDSLSHMGITRKDIMFGGIPSQDDSLRLGL